MATKSTKAKFEKFADEMLQEVKNLKDLTKKELPVVAQEYVRYNVISGLISMIFTGLIFGLSAYSLYHGLTLPSHDANGHSQEPIGWVFWGLIFGVVSGIGLLCSVEQYLSFKFQPRRKAIYAITSLFKGE